MDRPDFSGTLPGDGRAHPEIESGNAAPPVRPVDSEHLAGGAEFEHREVGNHDHCHGFQHVSSVAEILAFWAFLPLFLLAAQEQHGDMEIFVSILVIVLLLVAAATVAALLSDGRGHTPPHRFAPGLVRAGPAQLQLHPPHLLTAGVRTGPWRGPAAAVDCQQP